MAWTLSRAEALNVLKGIYKNCITRKELISTGKLWTMIIHGTQNLVKTLFLSSCVLVLSCGAVYCAVQGGFNFWVCGWNPKTVSVEWKLLGSTVDSR